MYNSVVIRKSDNKMVLLPILHCLEYSSGNDNA
jgi:hypothetical protein